MEQCLQLVTGGSETQQKGLLCSALLCQHA